MECAPRLRPDGTVVSNVHVLSVADRSPLLPSLKSIWDDKPPIELRSAVKTMPVLGGKSAGLTLTRTRAIPPVVQSAPGSMKPVALGEHRSTPSWNVPELVRF